MSTCRGSATGTQHIQSRERTGAATVAAFMLATASLACPTRTNGRTAKPGEGPTPTQNFWGSENVETNPFEIMGASNAHRNLVRAMGPECRCAVRYATATRVGVRGMCGVHSLHLQPAADRDAPRGRAARDGKSGGAWGFAARAQTAEGCTTHAVVRTRGASFRRCVVQVGRAVHLLGKLLCHEAHAG
jgi:hypothetical protein